MNLDLMIERGRGPLDGATGADVLPVQFIPNRGYHAWLPEKRLAFAVLADAVRTLRSTAGVETWRARRIAAEERAWILSNDTSRPFAFLNVCSYLGVDAAWLRAGLLRVYHTRVRTRGPAAGPDASPQRARRVGRR